MAKTAILSVKILGDSKSAQKALSDTQKKTDNWAGRASKQLAPLTKVLTGVAAGIGAAGAAALKAGYDYQKLRQGAFASFKTLTGSATEAKRILDDIREWSRSSPFPQGEIIRFTQKMMAFGFETEKILPMMTRFQDQAAAMGRGTDAIGTLADVFSKARASGRFLGDDLNRLSEIGINFAEAFEAAGVKYEKGTAVDFEQGSAAILASMDKVAGAADNVKNTWEGATDRVKGALRDLGAAFMAPLIPDEGGGPGAAVVNKLADALRRLEPWTQEKGREFGAFIEQLNLGELDPQKLETGIAGIGKLAGGLAAVAGSLKLIDGVMKRNPIAILITALAGAALGMGDLDLAGKDANGMLDELNKALDPLGSLLDTVATKTVDVAGAFLDLAKTALPESIQQNIEQRGLIQGLTEDIGNLLGSVESLLSGEWADAWTKFRAAMEGTSTEALKAKDGQEAYKRVMEESRGKWVEYSKSLSDASKAEEVMAKYTSLSTDELGRKRGALAMTRQEMAAYIRETERMRAELRRRDPLGGLIPQAPPWARRGSMAPPSVAPDPAVTAATSWPVIPTYMTGPAAPAAAPVQVNITFTGVVGDPIETARQIEDLLRNLPSRQGATYG